MQPTLCMLSIRNTHSYTTGLVLKAVSYPLYFFFFLFRAEEALSFRQHSPSRARRRSSSMRAFRVTRLFEYRVLLSTHRRCCCCYYGCVFYCAASAFAGPRATIHACTLNDDCMVGAGATVMDGATVSSGAMVAPGATVSPNTTVPAGQVQLETEAASRSLVQTLRG